MCHIWESSKISKNKMDSHEKPHSIAWGTNGVGHGCIATTHAELMVDKTFKILCMARQCCSPGALSMRFEHTINGYATPKMSDTSGAAHIRVGHLPSSSFLLPWYCHFLAQQRNTHIPLSIRCYVWSLKNKRPQLVLKPIASQGGGWRYTHSTA